jgi:hypothetical protein
MVGNIKIHDILDIEISKSMESSKCIQKIMKMFIYFFPMILSSMGPGKSRNDIITPKDKIALV